MKIGKKWGKFRKSEKLKKKSLEENREKIGYRNWKKGEKITIKVFFKFGFLHQIPDFLRSQSSSFNMLGLLLMHAQNVLFSCQRLAADSTVGQAGVARGVDRYPRVNAFPFLPKIGVGNRGRSLQFCVR